MGFKCGHFIRPKTVGRKQVLAIKLKKLNYKQLFSDYPPQVLVYSDASKFACGANMMLNKAIAHRIWAEHEGSKNSTWREIKAIHFSLLSFLPFLRQKGVFWHTDNKDTVSVAQNGSSKNVFSCVLTSDLGNKYFIHVFLRELVDKEHSQAVSST